MECWTCARHRGNEWRSRAGDTLPWLLLAQLEQLCVCTHVPVVLHLTLLRMRRAWCAIATWKSMRRCGFACFAIRCGSTQSPLRNDKFWRETTKVFATMRRVFFHSLRSVTDAWSLCWERLMKKYEHIDACAGVLHTVSKTTCFTWCTWLTLPSRNAFGTLAPCTSHGLHQGLRDCKAVPLL